MLSLITGLAVALLTLQLPATVVLFSRLAKGKDRRPPLKPRFPTPEMKNSVSVIVPTLNEAHRITPCLAGLHQQTEEVREILIIDSNSQDGTQDIIRGAMAQDSRFRLITDDPLPPGWVGRPWALHTGFLNSSPESEWVLGVDADTMPLPGLVASLLEAAGQDGYDVLSVGPQFILKYPGELLLHPAMLVSLIYRVGPPGTKPDSRHQVMGNGQCFMCRRSVLHKLDGYIAARGSFCDDVTLARYMAQMGFKVAFLDGAEVLKVRMYEGAMETWRELGRTSALKDASTPVQMWGDVVFLLATQGLPVPVVLSYLFFLLAGVQFFPSVFLLLLNLLLLAMRVLLQVALAPSCERSLVKMSWLYWLSPLVDPLAWLRVFLSAVSKPKQWRGRYY